MFHTKQDVDRHVNEIFKNLKGDSEVRYISQFFETLTHASTCSRSIFLSGGSSLWHFKFGSFPKELLNTFTYFVLMVIANVVSMRFYR